MEKTQGRGAGEVESGRREEEIGRRGKGWKRGRTLDIPRELPGKRGFPNDDLEGSDILTGSDLWS